MPQLPFAEEHKAAGSNLDYPRLKLKKDERKRILALEDPTFAYVHELRAPKIIDGAGVLVTAERGGQKYVDFEKDFIGRPLCLGDLGTLLDKGVDPKNCPACQRSTASDEVGPPKRRFAMPVIVYATKPGSFELRTPFSCELVVWAFTDKAYNKLVDIVKEWGENGKIRNHDLTLGPCTVESFQQYEINVASTAAWTASEERKKHVLETYQEQKPSDLEQFCGRKIAREWMIADLEKIRERWAIANGKGVSQPTPQDAKALTDGLENLLHGGRSDSAAGSAAATQVDVSDILDDAPKPDAKPAQKEHDKAGATSEPIDFNTLLDSLQ